METFITMPVAGRVTSRRHNFRAGWGNTLAGSIGGGVHVGNQAQGRLVLTAGGGGDAAVDIAVLVYPGIPRCPEPSSLLPAGGPGQTPALPRGGCRSRVGGSVNADIIQQSLVCTHKNAPLLVFDSMIRFSAAIYKRVQQGSADRSAVKQQNTVSPLCQADGVLFEGSV